MPSIDFSKIAEMLESSTDFSLSEKQYKKLTGRTMPKDISYLTHRSAMAKFAESKGLKIHVQEKQLLLKNPSKEKERLF